MTTPERWNTGAIDLAEIKARAEAQARSGSSPDTPRTLPSSVEITRENIETEVLQRSLQVPVVVLIGHDDAPESADLRRDLTDLAAAANLEWIFAYLDGSRTPELAQIFGVTAVPTVVALAGGRPLADFQGGQPLSALQEWTAAVVGACAGKLRGLDGVTAAAAPGASEEEATEPSDPRFAPAEEALDAGDYNAAIAVYDGILAKEPANTEAKLARGQVVVMARLAAADPNVDAIAVAEARPTDVDAVFAAADQLVSVGQIDAAAERLIRLLRMPDEKARVQARLVELLALFPVDDPRVIAARGAMANALF